MPEGRPGLKSDLILTAGFDRGKCVLTNGEGKYLSTYHIDAKKSLQREMAKILKEIIEEYGIASDGPYHVVYANIDGSEKLEFDGALISVQAVAMNELFEAAKKYAAWKSVESMLPTADMVPASFFGREGFSS